MLTVRIHRLAGVVSVGAVLTVAVIAAGCGALVVVVLGRRGTAAPAAATSSSGSSSSSGLASAKAEVASTATWCRDPLCGPRPRRCTA